MKQINLLLISVVLTLSSMAQPDKEKIWDVIIKMEKALSTRDSIQLKKILHPRFVGISTWGWIFLKEDYISFHCRKEYGTVNIMAGNISDAMIHIYGNTAIVNRQTMFWRKEPDGTIGEMVIQRIEVLVNEDNQWLIVSGQGTEVNKIPRPVRN